MEFRILGALEVRDDGDGRIPLGAGKQRAVLALLLVHANEVVPTERLIEEIWGESPPETARKAVQVYVARLRKALGAERIRTHEPGYVLELDSHELDLHRFEARVQEARELRENGDYAGAAIALRDALALWSGPPLADFTYEPFAQTEIPRLEERRLEALEERIDADLALGHGADLVGELEALIAKHPFRERLRGQLMLALYRDGRQADALRVFQETRRLLVDELGIEPSPALQRLEGAILRQEPALETILEKPAPTTQPTGTVTFLFTNIEGSTRLVKQLRTGYDAVLAHHQQILRDAFEAHGGREVDMSGEAFLVAFSRAGDAVTSAIDAQRALAAHAWPEGVQVRVRMGLHSGEPRAVGERYVGIGVHRAARVGSVGHGGQVLLSNATRELVDDELPPETRLRDLGSYRLKDLDRPEQLFQLEAEGLQHEFPPLKAPRVARPHRLRRLSVLVALAAGAVAAAVAIPLYLSRSTQSPVGAAGNPITVLVAGDEREQVALIEMLKAFEQETGLETQHASALHFASAIRRRIRANPPMLAIGPSPGLLTDLAREGALKPLTSLGIGTSYLRRNYDKAWLDLGTVDGTPYGLVVRANSKSVFWYRPDRFTALGLRVPKTWAELLAVTKEIKAAGETPWALGARDSWTLTDWFENIYVRTAGPAKYRRLHAGQLSFDDTSVIAALRLMTTILNDRYVAGGVQGALGQDFLSALTFVFGKNPSAHLYMEGGFVGPVALSYVNPGLEPGKTIDVAPFPTINPRLGKPLVGGGDLTAVFVDNEAVRKLLRYLSSPEAGTVGASTGEMVSPNRRVPSSAYPDPLVRAEAKQVAGAKTFVFDGSDLLPAALGGAWGSTLQRVIQKPEDIPALTRDFQRKAARAFSK